jgi:hypothetical protein
MDQCEWQFNRFIIHAALKRANQYEQQLGQHECSPGVSFVNGMRQAPLHNIKTHMNDMSGIRTTLM